MMLRGSFYLNRVKLVPCVSAGTDLKLIYPYSDGLKNQSIKINLLTMDSYHCFSSPGLHCKSK